MKKRWAIISGIGVGVLVSVLLYNRGLTLTQNTGAPPYNTEDDYSVPEGPVDWLEGWHRPNGPPKVGLQVGHWQNDQLPDELERLRGSSGATAVGLAEWEVNLAIAQETKKLLEKHGIMVDILSATVPERYWADVFVAIHADGNSDPNQSGFKLSPPRRDFSGKASLLASMVENSYGSITGLTLDSTVTRNMRGYYAFSWWRYVHAVHPKTASIILETGFLTSPADRKTIVDQPELVASGLATGIIHYLEEEQLL